MKLTYEDYSDFHARKCSVCKGAKRVRRENIWVTCGCQFNATAKWRYDQIQIYPEDLKFKTWDDFCGISINGSALQPQSFFSAKSKALQYCFGSSNPNAPKNRAKSSIILDHLKDGQNVIIAGSTGSGRSLLASLILKEVVYASAINQYKVGIQWIRAMELLEAARWATEKSGSVAKSIDRDKLENWAETSFLFIDGMDIKAETGDHRAPPDMASVNLFFSSRLLDKLPTIIICSDKFLKSSRTPGYQDRILEQWGEELINLMNDSHATVIELTKVGKLV